MIELLDSYSEANQDDSLFLYNSSFIKVSQSFHSSKTVPLRSAKWYIAKVGSPPGNITVELFNITGSSGSTAIPTGSTLATAATLTATSLSTSFVLTEFLFTGANRYNITPGDYVVTLTYSGGDSSNYVKVGVDNSSPSASGNSGYNFGAGWNANNLSDFPFYVYGVRDTSSALLLFD